MAKDLAQKLLRELLKNSKRSDRDLAKVLRVSQPTITRARHRLEKSGMIKDYTVVPDFKKMGFQLLVINLAKIRPEVLLSEMQEKLREYATQFPNTILASTGDGMGMNAVSISFYGSFTEFHRRANQRRIEWKDIIEDLQSFVIPIGEMEFKRFSLKYLGDVPL